MNPVVLDGQTAGILVRDQPGELGVVDRVKLEFDIRHTVASSSIACHLDHSVLPVHNDLELEPVAEGCLVIGHVALE